MLYSAMAFLPYTRPPRSSFARLGTRGGRRVSAGSLTRMDKDEQFLREFENALRQPSPERDVRSVELRTSEGLEVLFYDASRDHAGGGILFIPESVLPDGR